MNYKNIFFVITLIVICSCATKKDIYYFQDINETIPENSFEYLSIQPGDILDIQIKALKPESVQIFKRESATIPQQNQFQNRAIDGFLVGDDYKISLPMIGSVNTQNKTTQTLANLLEDMLAPYVTNPSVNIRILNFRVSVLGEVVRPGTFSVLEERISIPQALGLAGDLTINGDRNNVLVIRNENDKIKSKVVDLTKSNFLDTPFYFLKQNDVIYVRPNNAKVKSSGLIGNANSLTSVLSLIVSLVILITN